MNDKSEQDMRRDHARQCIGRADEALKDDNLEVAKYEIEAADLIIKAMRQDERTERELTCT